MSDKTRMSTVWQNFLANAKAKKKCMACDRGIHDNEAGAIEKYVSGETSPEVVTDFRQAKCSIGEERLSRYGRAQGG